MKYPFPQSGNNLDNLASQDALARDICNRSDLRSLQMFLVETYAASPLTRKGRMVRLRRFLREWIIILREDYRTKTRYTLTVTPARYSIIDMCSRSIARECLFRVAIREIRR